MPADPFDTILRLLFILPLFLFALTVHECAHAWMARREGDPTAEQEGRLSLNPLVHLDPAGVLMFVLAALSGVGFGWAKPVPVRLGNCPRPLTAMWRIALAGPVSNLLQAALALPLLLACGFAGAPLLDCLLGGAATIFERGDLGLAGTFGCILAEYFRINVVLALFNLIPIPPLDGGRILVSVLPYRAARFVASLEQYGFLILLLTARWLAPVFISGPLAWIYLAVAKLALALGLG
ncbi:MAG: site-2 protease family protein [Fimbriimonadaceae bacterium]|nr:site-2 protease family protein [Fimbriimonadaceae bacterium]